VWEAPGPFDGAHVGVYLRMGVGVRHESERRRRMRCAFQAHKHASALPGRSLEDATGPARDGQQVRARKKRTREGIQRHATDARPRETRNQDTTLQQERSLWI